MKQMIWGMALSVLATGAADAALLSRAGGQAYYDDVLNITWLADANYAQISGYNNGITHWSEAQSWIGSLNAEGGGSGHLGANNWRLPLTAQPDASCSIQSPGMSYGSGCTGSEMGHLANVDGISASSPGPFSNVHSGFYWSGTADGPFYAWFVFFGNGDQSVQAMSNTGYAWAVSPGDIGAVPAPGALWLFGTGVGALGAKLKRRVRSPATGA